MRVYDHTAFRVSDLSRSIAFYKSLLGAEVRCECINEEEREAYAFLELEGGSLELIQRLGEDYERPAIVPPYCPHFAVETEDMELTMGLIRENSAPIIRGPLEIVNKERWVYVADPDNNIVEFIEWVSKEP